MSLQKINTRTIVLILMVIAGAAMRLITYRFPLTMSNFTPLGAVALFGGAYFTDKWKAYLVVLITLFASDLLINYLRTSTFMLWDSNSFWLYLAFAIMVYIGSLIKKASILNVAFASIASVCVHWLITDLPWVYGTYYPHNLYGYIQSLTAAIPFELNMVYADIVFCGVLFGGFELAKSKYVFLRNKSELAV